MNREENRKEAVLFKKSVFEINGSYENETVINQSLKLTFQQGSGRRRRKKKNKIKERLIKAWEQQYLTTSPLRSDGY